MDTGPLTIEDAGRRLRNGDLTPSTLLEVCLKRVDTYEPKVKAWAYLDRERARKEADQLTQELKHGQDRGALHGIPVGIKDIIDVADMPTGCGSALWANSYARQDAECVRTLRSAGALILGKTVTTPYAYLDPPQTRNPWNHERTPGGSSSGSAAAVACGMCLGALATQTGGSTIRPAAFCGVFALKPTHGTIPTSGSLPLAQTLDHIGLMANSAEGLSRLFHVFQSQFYSSTITLLWSSQLESNFNDAERAHWHRTRSRIQNQSLDPVSEAELPSDFHTYNVNYKTIISREAAEVHQDRYRRRPEDYPPEITQLIQQGLHVSDSVYDEAKSQCLALRARLAQTGQAHWGNIWLLPSTLGPAPTPETTGDPIFNIPWSYCGLPAVTVPTGLGPDGLPRAFQLVGNPGMESLVLRAASVLAGFFNSLPSFPPV